jgi:trans-aconitate 2-methyltransferase
MADAEITVDWDAGEYDRIADPQEEWGREVLARLELTGNETVLDAGCGSGRVTRLLLERLPEGRVIGVDASPSMIELARDSLADDAPVELLTADISALDLAVQVDAVFSNAVFHWVLDHDRLFASLFGVLRPGGVLEAQCGGQGNIAEWKNAIEASHGDERFAAYLRAMPPTHHFASVGDTEAQLRRAGFEVGRVWLETREVVPSDPRAYVRHSLSKEMARLPDELHDEYVDALLGSMPRPLRLNYVRLNISARKP